MKKKAIVCFLLLSSCMLWGQIQVDHAEDFAILERFFKTMLFSEEYGYVLVGAKPLSIRIFGSPVNFLITRDFEQTTKEFDYSLLIRKMLPVWNRVCAHQKNFVLKAVAIEKDVQSKMPALEVQFINLVKLKETIDENIDFFRYILGPTITSRQLVDKIAYSNESLMDCLQYNLTLVGIVLGFGTHNSVIGGRIETISSLSISRDYAPFIPQSRLMQSKEEHSLNFLTSKGFGYYFLELAGGNDQHFRTHLPRLCPSQSFASLEEEVLAIDALYEPLPSSLWQNPKFVFGAFDKEGVSNQSFFEYLKKTQQQIQALLKHPNFLEKVLEKIGKQKALITCKKCSLSDETLILSDEDWDEIFGSVAENFKNPQERSCFVQAFLCPTADHQEASVVFGDAQAMLKGLQKALANLTAAQRYFKQLSTNADIALQMLVPERLYFKTTCSGLGKTLAQHDRVRVGYIIEDLEKNILFANYDTWLSRSQILPSLAYGMQGMRVGETRTLLIHPAFGYGALTTLPPCIGLTITVQLLDFEEKAVTALPALMPLDLDWIQDTTHYRDLESAIQQKPYFVGAFYRYLFDVKEKASIRK